MDVIGIDIVGLAQRRDAAPQTFDRQTVSGVDPGHPQDADGDAAVPAESSQLTFGINAAVGAGGAWAEYSRLVHPFAGAVAIDPRRTYIHDALW